MKNILHIVIVLLLLQCANQLPPSGGEVDTTPPEVVEVYPTNGTINFNDAHIEIYMSEYIDKRSLEKAIFISPKIKGPLEYDWSGESLEIYFEDTLKENTTYTVTIGTDVVDLNNKNNMAEAYNFAFSTGSEIDFCRIEGKVYDEDPSGVMLFAYKINKQEITPLKNEPDYISQVGKYGKYKLLALATGGYRVFAVRDEFRDLLYNIEEDYYGAPFYDVTLTEEDSIFTNLDFFLTNEDTTEPHIQITTMTDRNHILIELSEEIDSKKVSAKNFFIYDSTTTAKVDMKYLFKGRAKENNMFLSFQHLFEEDVMLYLVTQNLYDEAGNRLSEEITTLVANHALDTIPPNLINATADYGGNTASFEHPQITFYFDDGFDSLLLINNIKVIDKKENHLPYKINFLDDASFKINIEEKLLPETKYNIQIELRQIIDAAGNKIDSNYNYEFNTISNLDFTGVSGQIRSKSNSANIIVNLQNSDKTGKNYSSVISSDMNFKFEDVLPGKYFAWMFIDSDSNSRYTYGTISPFTYSEKFAYYPDTLNLRARWPIEDVVIRLD